MSITEGNNDDSELVSSLLKGDARGVYEIYLLKTSQDYWLNQVNNKWERYLFQSGNDRRNLSMVDGAKLEQAYGGEEVGESVYGVCYSSCLCKSWRSRHPGGLPWSSFLFRC